MTVEQENQYVQDRKTAYHTSKDSLNNLLQSHQNQHFATLQEEQDFLKNDYFPLAVTTLLNQWIWRFEVHPTKSRLRSTAFGCIEPFFLKDTVFFLPIFVVVKPI
jgi:hypothetical protein